MSDDAPLFPAIVALSTIAHVALVSFAPAPAPVVAPARVASEIVVVAPPLAEVPPPPPAEPAHEDAPPPAPRPAAPPRAAATALAPLPAAGPEPRPTTLEESTSGEDVRIDARVGEAASIPGAPSAPPVAPAPAAAPASAAPVRPAPSGALEPVLVPSKALGRLPRAPALDAELERNYPPDAKRAGVGGSATLRVQVLADGRVGRVERLAESDAGFAAACERTVRAARWDPPMDRGGNAVATAIKYVCRFEVRR